MVPYSKWPLTALALLPLPISAIAAATKPPAPTTPSKAKAVVKKSVLKSKPVATGKPLRIITTRVTMFYSFKDKKTHKLHPVAKVSKTLNVKVVKKAAQGKKRK